MNEKSVFALGIAPPKCQWKNWKKEIGTENKIKKLYRKKLQKTYPVILRLILNT